MRLAERIRDKSIPLGKMNGYNVYELRKEMVFRKKDSYGIYHILKPDVADINIGKVVMFMGATGAGTFFKCTILQRTNSATNHLGLLIEGLLRELLGIFATKEREMLK